MEEVVSKIKSYETKILKCQEIISDASKNSDPETISDTLVKLARLNSGIGREAAHVAYLARNAEQAYKREREDKKLSYIFKGWPIGKAESQAFVDANVSHEIFSETKLIADQASDLSYRTDTFMRMAQSRLSLISKELNRNF